MRFEWDEHKNRLNIRNHRIDFQDVPQAFQGPMLIDLDDREDYGEDRWVGIGMLRDIPAVIVFSECGQDCLRLISARKANRNERKRYEQHF
jgi:uncharacterized DUF497 family protein